MTNGAESDQVQTSTIVGIDEAGYGPLLGPLVISATAFDVPVPILKAVEHPADGPDLWKLLRDSVTKTTARRDRRIPVADSKKLHGTKKGTKGISLLEQTALTFISQTGDMPDTFRSLLQHICPAVVDQLDRYPWYAGQDPPLPTETTRDKIGIQTSTLSRNLAGTGIRFRGAWAEVLPVGEYNRLVSLTHNKAVALFSLATRLIQKIADSVGPQPLRVWVDRQGGRVTYRRPLMTAFENAQLDVLEESPDRSGYRLTFPDAPWVIRFVKKGETHHLPIALASVVAKYTRELFMASFNRYWIKQDPDLRPTAGYYQDGNRFLAEIAPILDRQPVDRDLLVRKL